MARSYLRDARGRFAGSSSAGQISGTKSKRAERITGTETRHPGHSPQSVHAGGGGGSRRPSKGFGTVHGPNWTKTKAFKAFKAKVAKTVSSKQVKDARRPGKPK